MHDPKHDQDGAGHADGEAGNIDEGKSFVPYEISPRDLQIVLKHGELSVLS
jgi:hypothetical protein